MILDMIHGFCMSLADSVPGVSGGTVAFIMGFYEHFIGSIHDLTFENLDKKKTAFIYLLKLGLGWLIGMSLSVFILSSLFETHIYTISSLFIGFIAGSIPLILFEERENLDLKGLPFLFIGCFVVVLITWANGHFFANSMNLSHLSLRLGVQLFFIGMIAISAMFLPGISGSTLLLIFGAYIPILSAIKDVLTFHFGTIPCLFIFGCGVLFGAATVVKGIKICLDLYRPQMVYAILGMMIGSFYAIVQGPTTLEMAQDALSLNTFSFLSMIIGIGIVLLMQVFKERKSN